MTETITPVEGKGVFNRREIFAKLTGTGLPFYPSSDGFAVFLCGQSSR